jgi:hypothetical protein
MKTLLVILFFLIAGISWSQNSLYVVLQPSDIGTGLRYDHQFNKVGLYTSLTRGEYRFDNGYIKNHIKASFGGIVYLKDSFFTFGTSYHHYGDRLLPETFNTDVFHPFSLEIGMGIVINHFTSALRVDFKMDVSIDIGYKF